MTKVKSKKLIPLSYDLLFKKVFGDYEHKERAASLVSVCLNIPYEEIVNNIEILPNDKKLRNKKDKRQEQDVVVRIVLSINQRVNLEMNMNYNETNKNRNLTYLALMFSNQLKNKEDYKLLEPCIQINFNTVFTDTINNLFYDEYMLRNKYGNTLTNMLKIININIEECRNILYNKDISEYNKKELEIIKYGALMMETDYDKLKKVLEEFPMGEDILDSVEEYSKDEDFSYLYYDAEKNRRGILNGSITEAREEGKLEGIKLGELKGINKRNIEIAKELVKNGVDVNIISKSTGLSVEEINKF